jgi:hypothetical protein
MLGGTLKPRSGGRGERSVTSICAAKQLPLQRTAKYETLPLHRGKRRVLSDLVLAYTRVKDGLLRMLGRTPAWHHLDDPRGLRAATKEERQRGVPAHLQDQALFDAVDTMRRHIEGGIASIQVKAKVFFRPCEAGTFESETGRSGGRKQKTMRRGTVSGNIRVVLHQDRGTASVHVPYDVRLPAEPASGPAIGVDAGVSEVLATSTGEKLGTGYGTLLERLSEETAKTGQARNKLVQLAKKAEERGDAAKASCIRRNHLGHKKLRVKRERGEAAVKTAVGQVVRQALRRRPAAVAVDDLSPLRGRTKSRKLSRIVARWMRSVLRERLEFRSRAGGSRLETVNAVYSSQTCSAPTCGFVHKDNRHGDRFHCLQCGRAGW